MQDNELERAIVHALDAATASPCPPRLAEALRYAVIPGGARVRPRIVLAVARVCGWAHPEVARAGAVAIELLHCAPLVHDDLPMFDDAELRRGRPSVHRAFSEPLAVLVGDALIVEAFAVLASVEGPRDRLTQVTRAIARSVGAPRGIVAGQAWESEAVVDRAAYHRAKTGSLFVAAATVGALAGGGAAEPWAIVGERLGEAYQVADDLSDVGGIAEELGKPVGRDAALGRPSAVADLGVEGARACFRQRVAEAMDAMPLVPGRTALIADLRALLAR